MLSVWEQRSFQSYDVIIVGAGISGLSTAASLLEATPDLRVLVLERGLLPSGASTRNAGFACFGSLTELLTDVDVMGWDAMLQLVERRWRGLEKTTDRLGAEAIDLQRKGGWEMLYAPASDFHDQMAQINNYLRAIFREDVFSDRSAELSKFGLKGFQGMLYNEFEGQLDTGKLIASLWKYVTSRGAMVLTSCPVTHFESEEDSVLVHTPSMDFSCQQLILCTNAFTKELMDVDLVPGRGTVLVVEPEEPLRLEGTYHYDEGYFYLRDFYRRIIFGGGRNIDKDTEETTDLRVNPMILSRLCEDLDHKILPGQKYRITDQWSGIMAFGENKQPIVQRVDERVSLGVRLGGMGVAIGSIVGHELAEMVLPSIR